MRKIGIRTTPWARVEVKKTFQQVKHKKRTKQDAIVQSVK